MRTFSGAQAARFASGNFTVSYKVEIDRTGLGSWVDVTTLQGRDWVRQITIRDGVDDPCAVATIGLQRSSWYLSLAPLMTTSQLNVGGTLVTLAKKMRIWVYIGQYGKGSSAVPSAGWTLIFSGRIFNVDWSSDEIQVEARDFGGDIVDGQIKAVKRYAFPAANSAQTVMKAILDTWAGSTLPGTVALYSANGTTGTPFNAIDSPGWSLKEYDQQEMPIYAALDLISKQIGWVLKYRWNASANDFVFTWFDPGRSNTTPAYTFAPSSYFGITECSIHLAEIRNEVRIFYTDAAGQPQTYVNSDAVSIAAYGGMTRSMKLAEEATSQINTAIEAAKMVNGALSDLAQPTMGHTVEMPLFWPVEVCDVYKFSANYVHYDSDQTLAVTGFQHNIGPDKATTTMNLRGKPSAGVRTWFERQAKQVRKQFGYANWQGGEDESNQVPNGNFSQYTKG